MRKTQLQMIEKAKKHGFSDDQIALLSREDLTIQELEAAMQYFSCRPEVTDRELRAAEAERCINFLKEHRKEIADAVDYRWLLGAFLPECINETDLLLGNKRKFRIYKMYQYFLMRSREKGEVVQDLRLPSAYAYMLRHGFPVWHRKTLMRAMIAASNYQRFSLKTIHQNYPCLIDDYLHNGKNSLFYYLAIEAKLIHVFQQNNNELESLYDFENHHFRLEKDEFKKCICPTSNVGYIKYAVDKAYVAQKNLEQYPFAQQIADFCKKTKGLEPRELNKGVFTQWRIWKLKNPRMAKRIKESFGILGQDFTTGIPAFYFAVTISENCFVTVSYSEYESIYVGADNSNGWRTNGKATSWSFMISPDGRLFKKSEKAKKYIPFTIREFLVLYRKENICGKFMKFFLNLHEEKNIFYRDVFSDCLNTPCVIPLSFNEVADCHNRAELMLKKYKTAAGLRINWNKQNINLSYLIVKAYPLVEPGTSKEILLQQKDAALVADAVNTWSDSWGSRSDLPYVFLSQVLYKRILDFETKRLSTIKIEEIKGKYRKELEEELHTKVLADEYEKWLAEKVESELSGDDIKRTAADYVDMCSQTKNKVSLNIRSIKRLGELHDVIATNPDDYRRITGEVKVPKNSKFLQLRKILPPEFEWITTRKRLILETELQHHCVWSYADLITGDICAIYSFTDTRAEHTKDGVPRRYTVEFRRKEDGTYYVVQVQGKYDRVKANGMKEYIQSLLSDRTKQNAAS